MKQKYTLIALLGLIGTSCSNQDLEEKYTDVGQVQVIADIAKSRVSFNEANGTTYAYWQTGDAITLSTPTQGNLNYTATVSEDDATATTFAPEAESLKDIDGETVYACYPATTITDGIVALPATDEWTDAKPLPFAYAVSSITDSKVNLTFEHTFAFLKLTLDASPLEYATSTDGDKAIHRLSIKSASETLGIVAGTFNFEDKSINISEGTKEISFTLGKAFNPSEETKRNVYIPILPQSGGTAMTISLMHTHDGGEDILLEMDKQTPTGGFVAGHIYTLTLSGNSSADIEGESGEIHLAVGGTLSTFITAENKNTIKSLKLSGYLNGDDIKLLREMATGNGILTDLDVADATIVEGGGAYYSNYYTQNNVWGKHFFSRTNLAIVVLPENIISIDEQAFEGCETLNSVSFGNSITIIGEKAFYNCTSLATITIPADAPLTSIGKYAFYNCKTLNEISIQGESEMSIGEYAFKYCSSLASISLGKGLKDIGSEAFYECKALETVAIPENSILNSIGDKSFYNCRLLKSIIIPENLFIIGSEAFYCCESLSMINIPNKVTTIDNGAFSNCSSLGRVEMGTSVTTIGASAFSWCDALGAIVIPEGITEIKDGTFKECLALKTINIPDAVTIIGKEAFYNCSSMVSATIGQGVVSIGESAFKNCNKLKEIIVPNTTNDIKAYAFEYCSSLESVTLGNGVISIDQAAFRGCSSLKSIAIPESINYMGDEVFYDCYSLISATNVIIKEQTFQGCRLLSYVTINDKTTEISESTFGSNVASQQNVSLKEVIIPESVTVIRNSAFCSCKALEKVVIPETITEIESSAFNDCSALKSITLPSKLTRINSCTFMHCTSLTEIIVPNEVTMINSQAFENCKVMTKVTLGNNLTIIKERAFLDVPIKECKIYAVAPPTINNYTFSTSSINAGIAKLYVPKGSLTAYQESDWATYFGNIIEMEE